MGPIARIGLTASLLALAACDRGAPAAPPTSAPSSPAASGAATEAIKPHSGDLPQSSTPSGPAEGATAIGGVTGGRQDGGAASGGAPAPTGGDGATKSETTPPKK